jgi:hypothetical protein
MVHKFWLSRGTGGSPDTVYEHRKVWQVPRRAATGARYESGKIWFGSYTSGGADAYYKDGHLWKSGGHGVRHDVFCGRGKLVYGSSLTGEMVARYEGPDAGAAACSLPLLLG